jgi:hypothetical protein
VVIRRPFSHKPSASGDPESQQGVEQGRPTRDFDSEIAGAGEQAERLKALMAEALTVWLDLTAPWVVAFWERSIAGTVEEDPGAVIALGADSLRAVKHDAAGLIANARAHVQRRLVDDRREDWPHLKPQTDPEDPAFQRQGISGPFDVSTGLGPQRAAPSLVEGRLNGVLGDVASAFDHHGFALKGFERGDPYGHRGRWHPDRQHKPEWSDEMIEAMARYVELHDRYVAVLAEAHNARAERQRREASKLWETA